MQVCTGECGAGSVQNRINDSPVRLYITRCVYGSTTKQRYGDNDQHKPAH